MTIRATLGKNTVGVIEYIEQDNKPIVVFINVDRKLNRGAIVDKMLNILKERYTDIDIASYKKSIMDKL